MMDGALLEVEDIEVTYGKARAVNGATVRVPRGSITAIVGPNGAGKTTLLKAVCGLDNLRLGAYLRNDAAEVARTLDMVFQAFPRLKERQAQRSGSLSGGEQQMLAIGRALMASPTLIMADEMSQGLAPVIVQEVYRRLLEVNRQGVTILLVEQNARLAFKLAQLVYVMEQGRVVLEGPSAEVAASEHVQKAYLGVS